MGAGWAANAQSIRCSDDGASVLRTWDPPQQNPAAPIFTSGAEEERRERKNEMICALAGCRRRFRDQGRRFVVKSICM